MGPLNSIGNKACGLGAVVSAMGCSACFPALAGFGGATGLLALLANAPGWLKYRQWHRSVLGMVGPIIVLAATFTMSEKLLYLGMGAMFAVSIWDFVSPANRRCSPDGCALPAERS